MNAFEHQLSILSALTNGKGVESRSKGIEKPWHRLTSQPHALDFVNNEYRIAPPGAEPVYAVWDNELGLYANQIFHGPAAATQYAISGNAAARCENRFVPVKLQRAPDGT